MSNVLRIERSGPVGRVWLDRPDVRNALNGVLIRDLAAAFADLRRRRRGAGDRPRRQRQGVLRRRRPGVHARGRRLHLGAEPGRRRDPRRNAVDALHLPGAGGRPHPRRLLRRRSRHRLGLRHSRRRRRRELLAQRGAARPAAGDDQPLCRARHGRAGGAALLRDGRALRRRRGKGDGLRPRGHDRRGARCQGRRAGGRARRQRADGHPRLQEAGAGRRRPGDHARAARRDGAADRRHPRQRRRQGRGFQLPREAQTRMVGPHACR